jgi:hypothetical protein
MTDQRLSFDSRLWDRKGLKVSGGAGLFLSNPYPKPSAKIHPLYQEGNNQ